MSAPVTPLPQSRRPDGELVRRYVQRRATGDEEQRIEEYLLEHPDFLDDLETDLALHDGIVALSGGPPPAAMTHPGPVRIARPRRRFGRNPLPLAIAASVLALGGLAVSLGVLHRVIGERDALGARAAPPVVANVPVVRVAALRSSDLAIHVPGAADTALVLLRIIVPDSDADRYRVSISADPAGEPRVEVSGLVVQGDGSLSLALSTRDLVAGRYTLVAYALSADGAHEALRARLELH